MTTNDLGLDDILGSAVLSADRQPLGRISDLACHIDHHAIGYLLVTHTDRDGRQVACARHHCGGWLGSCLASALDLPTVASDWQVWTRQARALHASPGWWWPARLRGSHIPLGPERLAEVLDVRFDADLRRARSLVLLGPDGRFDWPLDESLVATPVGAVA